jgi:hypothetical protein
VQIFTVSMPLSTSSFITRPVNPATRGGEAPGHRIEPPHRRGLPVAARTRGRPLDVISGGVEQFHGNGPPTAVV